jgi:hypothetical protein
MEEKKNLKYTLEIKREGTLEKYKEEYDSDFLILDSDCRWELCSFYPEITYFNATGEFFVDVDNKTYKYVLTVKYD